MAIIGAGPAGSALASALAGGYRVVLIDRWERPPQKIGESLVPAARRILRDLGLLQIVEARGYAPYHGNQAYWGSDTAERRDFIADPDGSGWHLDRADFDLLLRDAAVARGAELISPARLGSLTYQDDAWHLTAETQSASHEVRARVVVDATGRSASVAKRLGVQRRHQHRTVAHWLRGFDTATGSAPDAGLSTIAATETGWWYTAPVDHRTGQRVLAFHCDQYHQVTDLRRLDPPPQIRSILDAAGFQSDGPPNRTSAGTATLAKPAGIGWLSVGDSGLGMDPLSSRGIYHALYTGMAAAASCDHALRLNDLDFADYAKHIREITETYMRDLRLFYRAEARWPEAPFWAARAGAPQRA